MDMVRSMGAVVIPFPCRRQVGLARRIAAKSLNESWDAGSAYDKRIKTNMRKAMTKAGIDAAIIDREVSEFTQAVVDEIRRQVRTERPGQENCA